MINRYIDQKIVMMSGTQAQKLELLEWLASLQDKSLIQELAKWKEDHQRISVEQYDRELEQADAEIDSGDYLTHEEAVKAVRSWREQ